MLNISMCNNYLRPLQILESTSLDKGMKNEISFTIFWCYGINLLRSISAKRVKRHFYLRLNNCISGVQCSVRVVMGLPCTRRGCRVSTFQHKIVQITPVQTAAHNSKNHHNHGSSSRRESLPQNKTDAL